MVNGVLALERLLKNSDSSDSKVWEVKVIDRIKENYLEAIRTKMKKVQGIEQCLPSARKI